MPIPDPTPRTPWWAPWRDVWEPAAAQETGHEPAEEDGLREWTRSGWREDPSRRWLAGELVWTTGAILSVVIVLIAVPALAEMWVALLLTSVATQALLMLTGKRR